ncbi:MAG: sulfite exporter TauE/SafE family protein [Planctomycetia bacterium]|nr:sulfite exporter TauE/SafE family protein [Planctomycetia bacterium]
MLDVIAVSLVSLAAGFVNSIAGGGGLVSLPILLSLYPAAPPATLFGTNKAAMVWGTAWASGSYARHVVLPWRMLVPSVVTALAGGAVGAWLVTLVSSDWLRRLLPAMLAVVLAYTIWRKDLGQTHAPKFTDAQQALLGALIALALGFYDGFFGPGTGSFFIFAFVKMLGFDFLNAVASAKVLNTATNLASLAVFAWSGHVWWPFMLPMALANVVGSALGTSLALKHGSGFVRSVFVLVVGGLIVKTAVDAYFH